jgi:uncharacterized protein (DUF2235 family)
LIGVDANILSAYCFICNNYNFKSNKDEIILIGFSRGAFTVRCLAHFIDTIGLLRRKNLTFLHVLFKRWLQGDVNELKKQIKNMNHGLPGEPFSYFPKIKVLGEWDPVSAMRKGQFSFISDNVPGNVRHAFLALALDEQRVGFKPELWRTRGCSTTVKQCAFMGCHSDIGGGNPDAGLSTASLLWMVAQIQTVCAANFDIGALLQLFIPLQHSLFRKDEGVEWSSWIWKPSYNYVKNFLNSTGKNHLPQLNGLTLI